VLNSIDSSNVHARDASNPSHRLSRVYHSFDPVNPEHRSSKAVFLFRSTLCLCCARVIMDSPHLQSSPRLPRFRTNSSLSVHSAVDDRGAIRRRSSARARSVTNAQADYLEQLSLGPPNPIDAQASFGLQWLTPQQSPQPQTILSESGLEPFPTWSVPTPPRSDSGVPTVCIDANDEPVTTGISVSPELHFEQPATSAEMRFVLHWSHATIKG